MLFISGSKKSSGRAATHSRFPCAQAGLVNQPLHNSTTMNEHQPPVFGLRVFFPALLCLEVTQKHHGNSLWSLLEMQACKAGWNEFCRRMNGFHISPKVTGLVEDNIWKGEVLLTTAQCPGLEKHWAQTHCASLLNWAQWSCTWEYDLQYGSCAVLPGPGINICLYACWPSSRAYADTPKNPVLLSFSRVQYCSPKKECFCVSHFTHISFFFIIIYFLIPAVAVGIGNCQKKELWSAQLHSMSPCKAHHHRLQHSLSTTQLLQVYTIHLRWLVKQIHWQSDSCFNHLNGSLQIKGMLEKMKT